MDMEEGTGGREGERGREGGREGKREERREREGGMHKKGRGGRKGK